MDDAVVMPRLPLAEFERKASQTRPGKRARDMARTVLADGKSMHDVAVAFGTIPQRVSSGRLRVTFKRRSGGRACA